MPDAKSTWDIAQGLGFAKMFWTKSAAECHLISPKWLPFMDNQIHPLKIRDQATHLMFSTLHKHTILAMKAFEFL